MFPRKFIDAAQLFIVLLLCAPGIGRAFSCETLDIAERFEKADRVFLIKVLDIRLEEFPDFDDLDIDDEHFFGVRPLSVGYEVLKELKGDAGYRPRLSELLNFTGIYANLLPGINYVIAAELPDKPDTSDGESEWASQFLFVSSCEVLVGYFAEDEEEVLEDLRLIFELAEAENAND